MSRQRETWERTARRAGRSFGAGPRSLARALGAARVRRDRKGQRGNLARAVERVVRVDARLERRAVERVVRVDARLERRAVERVGRVDARLERRDGELEPTGTTLRGTGRRTPQCGRRAGSRWAAGPHS